MRHVVPESEVQWQAIRAQGPGGQNVNKVANAVHLRFDIARSSLPEPVKRRLLKTADQRISSSGVVVIKAQSARSLEANKAEALARLQELVDEASRTPKLRKPTKPTHASKQRRLQAKGLRSAVKALRGRAGE
ncbi:MAG: alternative ribosome rescue aminoacyl-tRNA hydrolase ArfB [Rubrivivax sp.]